MTPEQLFAILDSFERQTRDGMQASLRRLASEKGDAALAPWNIRYASAGDVTRQLDPYLPFADSLRRWVDSFKRLHIGFNGARMQLDLLVQQGKYENGFMHGPVPPFLAQGTWVPARINFTSLARPVQLGSGIISGIATLFHEGDMPPISPISARMRPAFHRSFRLLRWPMRKRNQCFATVCLTMRTG
ncbi:hypothetical protein SODG_000349 [Sodalis praecaptivus]